MRKKEIKSKTKKRKTQIIVSIDLQIEKFIEYCVDRNLKQNTIDSYAYYLHTLKTFLKANEHTLMIDQVTDEDIRDLLDYLKKTRKTSQATVNSAIAHLKPFFNFLVENEIISSNPMEKIKKGKVDQKPIIPFTHEELQLILKQPDKSRYTGYRNYCIMLLLADTGMRISECLNIKIKDIHWGESRILLGNTKNRNARVVGLSEPVKKELKRFKDWWLKDCEHDEYFFQNQDTGKLNKRTVQEAIKKYGEDAGIEDVRISPHTFRHYYSINYLKNGGSTAGLRSVLGHLTITTVEKYLYWSNDAIVEQSNKYSPVSNLKI